MGHHHWDRKQLCLTEGQIEHHKQTQYALLKLNHIAAQHLLRLRRLHDDLTECGQIEGDLSTVSDHMNLLMSGCEQIIGDGLRQRPKQIIIRIRSRDHSSALKSSGASDENPNLAADPILQQQMRALFLIVGSVTRSFLAFTSSPNPAHMIKVLEKLTRALTRQEHHFGNLGAADTKLEIILDKPLWKGETQQLNAGSEHAERSMSPL